MFFGSDSQYMMLQVLAELMIILLILPLHEFAHAWTAYKLGDDTASYQGRMTLNPLAHLDPIGAMLMIFTGFGWAKPVPIDPTRFNRKYSIRFGMAVTALAGPVSNLLAAFIGMIVLRFYTVSDYYLEYFMYAYAESVSNAPILIYWFMYYFISVNIGLAVFNLIPIPPLDGSKVIGYFTGPGVERWFNRNYQIVRIAFLIVIFTGLLTTPLLFLRGKIYDLFWMMTNWIPKFFG